jgi:hypothetical protein
LCRKDQGSPRPATGEGVGREGLKLGVLPFLAIVQGGAAASMQGQTSS